MTKLSVLSTIALSSILLVSCTNVNAKMKKKNTRGLSAIIENAKDDDIFVETTKAPDYTHEMVEADADDQKIKQEVGVTEIDEELPGSEEDGVPYSRSFLAKKNTKRMQFWVEYFTKKNRDRFQRFINNGEEYRHIIEGVFESQGLPKELYFVGLIESGYYLGARSHASAVGPWQFIKGTGSRYGLKITSEVDERQDLFKASKAAAMYFKDLHNVFSSWELALSAYNAGEYGIIRRIMKHGTRDFYELSKNKQLPSETINYVPKVLAAMHVVNNAKKYGFHIPKKKNRLFDRTELKAVKKNISLNTIARRLNVDVALIKKLNPELKRSKTPRYFAGTYFLRLPKRHYKGSSVIEPVTEVATVFEKPETRKELNRRTASTKEIKAVQKSEPQMPETYKVRRGDSLISISRKFKTTPLAIAQANGFSSWKTRVQIGQVIRLTESERTVASVASAPKVKVTNRPIVYKVTRGDNLTDIAKLFDLKLSKIKKANNLKRGRILVGQKIVLPDTKKGIYTVKKGDYLIGVAKEFNQPLEAIIKLNRLKRGKIYPGQKIIVNMD